MRGRRRSSSKGKGRESVNLDPNPSKPIIDRSFRWLLMGTFFVRFFNVRRLQKASVVKLLKTILVRARCCNQ
ncbi:hypothetical protein PVL29_001284 [Vitis rotundifolia]|uniref:Uncharacterized protein n=1 Tax=Vitis rotundifolia TaxID=103349 RepID=A0AA39E507_VITRO|nr:hypothetical protein PVL29_001284 [Vitis rotundifolia]